MAWIMAGLAPIVISCSSEDKPEGGPQEASELELETEMSGALSLPIGEEDDDPVRRERIELMTRDATESVVRAANFLAEQSSFRVAANISFDVLQSDGRLIEFGAAREFTIRPPPRAPRRGFTQRPYRDVQPVRRLKALSPDAGVNA